jgi:5-hydroxyisourate hydrolase
MDNVSTHILDTSTGQPAAGVRLVVGICTNELCLSDYEDEMSFSPPLCEALTNSDGRASLVFDIAPGVYKVSFFVNTYFESTGTKTFYPKIDIIFRISDVTKHYHVPLLLSPYGYSTYRGS